MTIHWSIQVMAEIWVYFQFLTITMVQITMTMTFGRNIFYNFCVFNFWSYIFIFLMVCCTSMSQLLILSLTYQLFLCTCSAPSVSQFSSVTQSCPTLCDPMDYSTPSFLALHDLLELAQAHIYWVSDNIQSSHPLSSPSPPAFNLSQHQSLYQRVSSSYHVAKEWELQLQHQSVQWIFRIDFILDWLFDLLAVQRTLKSLLQHHSSKASILQHSAFFMVQLSHPYLTIGKTKGLLDLRWQSNVSTF